MLRTKSSLFKVKENVQKNAKLYFFSYKLYSTRSPFKNVTKSTTKNLNKSKKIVNISFIKWSFNN